MPDGRNGRSRALQHKHEVAFMDGSIAEHPIYHYLT